MATILNKRRCGNTTRQVDEWIQQLFNEEEVVIEDYGSRGKNMGNKHAEDIFFNRLKNEHGLYLTKNSRLEYIPERKSYILRPF